MGIQARTGKNETRDAEIHVCDVVEMKLANLAYINTKQTKCHTSEVHKKGCAMMGLRLAGNRIDKQCSRNDGATRQ